MQIRDWVARDFGLDLDLTPVHGGYDAAAVVHRGVDADGSRYAVKWSGGGSPAGLVVLDLLGAGVVRTAAGALWTVRDGRRLSVVRWVEGTPALDGLDREHWIAYGRLLADLHRTPVEAVSPWVPHEVYDPTPQVAAFDAVDRLVTDRREPSRLTECWAEGRDRLHAVRARALRPVGAERPPVLCHADPHLGNLVVTGSARVELIDFDDAVLAPPERDLMFVLGGGVLAFAPVTPEQREWFFEGYGPHGVDADQLRYFRCVRALEDVAEPAGRVLDPTRGAAERDEALGHVEGALSPTGLVDQALGD